MMKQMHQLSKHKIVKTLRLGFQIVEAEKIKPNNKEYIALICQPFE